MSIINDISLQKKYEQNLIEKSVELSKSLFEIKKINKDKDELLLSISHDLRTPLNGIMGAGDLAVLSDDKEKMKKYLNIINESSKHLLKLIDKILKTKTKEYKKEFNIDEYVNHICALFEKKCIEKN